MPVAGRKPKPDGQKRNRVKPVHEWTEIEDKPFEGPVPVELPEGLSGEAVGWWAVVCRLPQCVLWNPGDWKVARDSTLVADAFYKDPSPSKEKALRDREKLIGMTLDQRRNLRIRYVEPEPEAPLAEVRSLDEYVGMAGSNKPA